MDARVGKVRGFAALFTGCWLLAGACSSSALPGGGSGGARVPGGGGAGAGGAVARGTGGAGIGGMGVGGAIAHAMGGSGSGGSGIGGAVTHGVGGPGVGGAGAGGSGMGGAGLTPDPPECAAFKPNPDSVPGGACAPDCQSVSCSSSQNRACTQDCCAACGIDFWAVKLCTCPNPGTPYANCSCPAPSFIPSELHGGTCAPAGDSRPAAQVSNSLRLLPCRSNNLVCFTADSTPSSERGCICRDDGVGNGGMGSGLYLHCGVVNHWFLNDGLTTNFTPGDGGI